MTGPDHSLAKRKCRAETGQKVDNSGSTLRKLVQLYRQQELFDVQLQVGPCLFHAHKLILSMSSDVFKTMLTDSKWPDASKALIVLSEEPECIKVFEKFLKYMYSGSIHLDNHCVLPVLTLADKYNIHDLGKVCKLYMLSHCHASLSNLKVVSWLQYATLCSDRALQAATLRYIELNVNHVMLSEDFLTMRLDRLRDLLLSPRLVVHSEYSLYQGLRRWILHHADSMSECSAQTAVSHVSSKAVVQLMSHVRFPLMKHAQLLLLLSDPLQQHFHSFFAPLLQEAFAAHSKLACRAGHSQDAVASAAASPFEWRLLHNQASGSSERLVACRSGKVVPHRKCDFNVDSSSSACPPSVDRDAFTVSISNHNADNAFTVSSPNHSSDNAFPVSSPYRNADSAFTVLSPNRNADNAFPVSTPHHGAFPLACPPLNLPVFPPHPGCQSSIGASSSLSPRNYTCDDWSTCLIIDDFLSFPRYGSQTYFFSTPLSAVPALREDSEEGGGLEWQAELYPKGVRFQPATMIGIPQNYDIDESCRDVVRLALSCKSQRCRVDVSVLALATGKEDGTEFVQTLTTKSCIFDSRHAMHNMDHIVPFDDLLCFQSPYLTESAAGQGSTRRSLKLRVIVKPTQ